VGARVKPEQVKAGVCEVERGTNDKDLPMKRHARLSILFALGLFLAGCGELRQAMVSTANEHASAAAAEILAAGGNAADAAIAAQLVLGLVEPQSSGLGGGAFALHWDAGEEALTAWDGRETAPVAAPADLFSDIESAASFHAAATGGRAVGVPGIVSLLWELHRAEGELAWEELFGPALRLAEEGFPVSPRLHRAIADAEGLSDDPMARELYFRDGRPLAVGDVLKNPAYASTLRRIEIMGPVAFYDGETAEEIVAAVSGHAGNPGLMTRDDVRRYHAQQRQPVCLDYRGYEVCGMPPPTSGGLTMLMILGQLEPYRMGAWRPNSPTALHLLTQASRLAFADRNAYMADPDYVAVPSEGLIDPRYLRARALAIHPGSDMGEAEPGTPPGAFEMPTAAATQESGTSHLAIVDTDGNAVSMTTSVERSFGARIMVGGFVLNSQLTDFAFEPERDGELVANRVEGGKRPRSSMAPTMVFDADGNLYAALGSPGGPRIIGFVAQTLVGLIDWDLPMQAAIDLPRAVNMNGTTQLEADTRLQAAAPALEAMGHEVEMQPMDSGLHGIRITDDGLDGGADRRREGVVIAVER
jgi:gamma-glutamyltranspeptidase / glutathione hydrolase